MVTNSNVTGTNLFLSLFRLKLFGMNEIRQNIPESELCFSFMSGIRIGTALSICVRACVCVFDLRVHAQATLRQVPGRSSPKCCRYTARCRRPILPHTFIYRYGCACVSMCISLYVTSCSGVDVRCAAVVPFYYTPAYIHMWVCVHMCISLYVASYSGVP